MSTPQALSTDERRLLTQALLACGAVSAVVYALADVLSSLRWEGYRLVDRAMSELMAVGAPTREFIVPFMTAYNLLVIAFGVGVWMVARDRRSIRVAGVLLVVYGMVSWAGLVLFPLRPDSGIVGGGAMPLSGVLHSAATVVLVLLMFAFIGFGSGADGRGFRVYSIATIAVILAGGVFAGSQVERVASGEIVRWFGVIERANIYGSLLWVAVLAFVLLRAHRERVPEARTDAAAPPRKRVLAIVGSAHKGGATYSAARTLLDNLEAYGDVEGEIVTLSDYDIRTCRGCKSCFNRGEDTCPLKDDRDVIFNKMRAADGIVWASPNYSWQVSGYMKIFLDRIGFVFHRPSFHGKTATALVVQGVAFGGRVRKYLEFCSGGLGCTVVKGSVIQTLEPMTDKALSKRDTLLAGHARRFHEQLLRPAFPTPSLLKLMLFRMSRTGIKLHAPRELHDWSYYRDKGWFESDYYYPVRLGIAKRAAGAFFDWVGAHMSTFEVAKPADSGGAHPA